MPAPEPSTSISTMSDEQLAWMVAARDAGSLEELYDRYLHQCYCLAYRILGVDASAEAAVHEAAVHDVFILLWNDPDAYSESRVHKDLVSWVLYETHSACLTILRSQSRDMSVSVELQPDQAALPNSRYRRSSEGNEPAVRVPQYASSQHVQHELQYLPQGHRQALELAYFEGLSQQQIATRLGQPQEMVAQYLRDGLNIVEA